jgi:hypothetical protein
MLFALGRVVATPGALERFTHDQLFGCLKRHVSGDWGDLDTNDFRENTEALLSERRIFSSYVLSTGKLWIITEADRSVTTFLLPEEY